MWLLAVLLQATNPCSPAPTPSTPPTLVVQAVDPLWLPLPGAEVRVIASRGKAAVVTEHTRSAGLRQVLGHSRGRLRYRSSALRFQDQTCQGSATRQALGVLTNRLRADPASSGGTRRDGLVTSGGESVRAYRAVEQADEADEALGGTAIDDRPDGGAASCPRGQNGRGHRFAAYPRCSADTLERGRADQTDGPAERCRNRRCCQAGR